MSTDSQEIIRNRVFDNLATYCQLSSPSAAKSSKLFVNLPLFLDSMSDIETRNVVKAIPLCQNALSGIPQSEKYLSLADKLIQNLDGEDRDLNLAALVSLAGNSGFCGQFARSGKLINIFRDWMDKEEFIIILKIFENDVFFEEILQTDGFAFIGQMFTFIIEGGNATRVGTLAGISFIFELVKKFHKQEPRVFRVLRQTDGFDRVTAFLMLKENQASIWAIYSIILECSTTAEIPVNVEILSIIFKILKSDELLPENRAIILEKIAACDMLFQVPFCLNAVQFPIAEILNERLFSDDSSFRAYLKIIERCAYVGPDAISVPIMTIFMSISPTNKSQCEILFEWLLKMINELKLSSDILKDELFLRVFFIDNERRIELFLFGYFERLFATILNADRNPDLPNAVFKKAFSSGLLRFLDNNFSFGFIRFLFENIEDNVVSSYLLNHITDKLVNMCDASNMVSLVNWSSENYVACFLHVISQMTKLTNNHWFDDYVLTLPPDAPIFSIPGSLTASVIVDKEHPDGALLIPSLVPLLSNNYCTESYYNLYLLGRYAIPIFRKLGKLPQREMVRKVCDRYMAYEDYVWFMENNLINLSGCDRCPVECYEFIPGTTGTIRFSGKNSPNYISFYVKFPVLVDKMCHVLRINNLAVFVKGNCIVLPSKKKIQCIKPDVWHRVTIKRLESLNWTSVYVDNERILWSRMPMDFEFIGTDKDPVTMRFYVTRNIIMDMSSPDEKMIRTYRPDTPCKMALNVDETIGYCHIHSLAMMLSDDSNLFHSIDYFDLNPKGEVVSLIMMQCDLLDSDQKRRFFRRFKQSLIQMKNIAWMKILIDRILHIEDISCRTTIFEDFFYDLEMWTSLDFDDISTICSVVTARLSRTNMDFKSLFRRERFMFLLTMMYIIEDPAPVFGVIRVFGERSTDLTDLIPILLISNLWHPDLPVVASEFDMGMICNIRKSTEVQVILVGFFIHFEKIHGKRYFEYNASVLLALGLPTEIGSLMFTRLVQETENDGSGFAKLHMICTISMRYAHIPEIWSMIIRKATGVQRFSIECDDMIGELASYPVVFPKLICVLLAMAIAVTNSKLSFTPRAMACVMNILSGNPTIIFNDIVFEYFVILVGCGDIPVVNEFSYSLDSSLLGKITQNDVVTLKRKAKEYRGEFAAYMRDMLQMYNKYDKQYLSFVTQVVVILCEKLYRQYKLWKKLMDTIMLCANPAIISAVLKQWAGIISRQKNIESKRIREFVRFVNYSLLNNISIFDIEFVAEICELRSMYADFFDDTVLYSIGHIGSEHMNILIESLLSNIPFSSPLMFLVRTAKSQTEAPSKIEEYFTATVASYPPEDQSEFALALRQSRTFAEFRDMIRNIPFVDSKYDEFTATLVKGTTKIDKSNTEEKLCQYLFGVSVTCCIICFSENQQLYHWINRFLREKERFVSFYHQTTVTFNSQLTSPDKLKAKTKSYHISPFCSPLAAKSVVVPSPFDVYTPSDPEPPKHEIEMLSLKMRSEFPLECELTADYPTSLFRLSSAFQCSGADLRSDFVSVYGEYQRLGSCELVRLDLRVPCVYFYINNDIYLLTDAVIVNDALELKKVTPFLAESVLLNEFGEYSLFCGHFVIIVKHENLMCVQDYVSCSISPSRLIYSFTNGSFILENIKYSAMSAHSCFSPSAQSVTAMYHKSEISTFEYLTMINLLSHRSFSDLSAYPIFPRLLVDFKSEKAMVSPKLRDLAIPMPIYADTDPEHTTFKNRMNMQKFHHAENVSNPVIVSSFNVRLLPFSRYMWDINNGWDRGDRNFMSIPFHLTISRRTAYELIPELFCLPEALLNSNEYKLPDGSSFTMELPNNVKDEFHFIELHRRVLESREVAENIHSWIDLIFGYKQASADDLNMFSPMSYYSKNPESGQKTWMQTCGQVPRKLFNDACPRKTNISNSKFNKRNIDIKIFGPRSGHHSLGNGYVLSFDYTLSIKKGSTVIEYNDAKIPMSTCIHYDLSRDKQLVAITFSVGIVYVVRIVYDKQENPTGFRFVSKFICRNPKMTTVDSNQMICATACSENVIIWSVSSSMVIHFITLENTSCLTFDGHSPVLYLAQGNTLFEYTVNGHLMRKIVLMSNITAIGLCGNGFAFTDKVIVTGHSDGRIRLVNVTTNGNFSVMISQRVAKTPIREIQSSRNSYLIHVHEIY